MTKKKINFYKNILENYFKDLGAEEVEFLKRNPSKNEIEKAFKNKNVLYLPGGNELILFEELKKFPEI